VGGSFGQDFEKFRKNFLIHLGTLLKQDHRQAKLTYSFPSQWPKI